MLFPSTPTNQPTKKTGANLSVLQRDRREPTATVRHDGNGARLRSAGPVRVREATAEELHKPSKVHGRTDSAFPSLQHAEEDQETDETAAAEQRKSTK